MEAISMITEKPLTAKIMLKALKRLDELLKQKIELIVGGGGAMILAHNFPLSTTDIDAISKGIEMETLNDLVKKIALELDLPGDWLNPYFSAFSMTLPVTYRERLCSIFAGKNMTALALGKEDMLIMKCFAHRNKDIGHAKSLLKQGTDIAFVEDHIISLNKKSMKGAQAALDFLDEIREDL